ncbi:MAG: ABC-F family ATP-binding cassette domain-containing protein [Candidatus Izemoplasmatales bacterium]|jgi:ATP-binding cassette subfamily F protein 3|nr:ABC-F family ATP-binding cassette domain-containing protein [Candidatus Izemoplasmatales bacterium]
MNLLKINNLKKTFGGSILFDKVSLEVNRDDKVALIGRNGVGKSTLIKMILGDIAPDSGDIFIFGDTVIGYLSQDVLSDKDLSLIEEVSLVFQEIIDLENQIQAMLITLEKNHDEITLEKYSRMEERYRFKGGYEYHTFIDMILTKFGFSKEDYYRKVATFSGGEKTRVAFAKLLLTKPDILLLDEPTNHMDIEIIEWLEDYLKHYDGAVFVVTHDKYFINKIVNKIYEIDQFTLHVYYGKFDDYEIEKVRRYEILMKQFIRQNKQIDHLQSFVDRFRYKATKAKSAQDRIKKINRIERISKPTIGHQSVKMAFHSKRPTDAIILETHDLAIGYEDALFKHIEFSMRGFEKIGIIGPNGIGKSTFIKTIIDEINPIDGEVVFNKTLKIGYFDQNIEYLDTSKTVLNLVHDIYPTKTQGEVRGLLAKVLFVGEDVFKLVSVLSGGERVRLRLLLLMLEEPELLILDEPTNHLDIETKNIVEDVFEEYIGPIIFISHDRYFINKVATKIVSLTDTAFDVFDGNYDEFKNFQESKIPKKTETIKKEKTVSSTKMIKDLEKKIDELQKQKENASKSLFLSEVYLDKIKYQETEELISNFEKEIEKLFEKILLLSDD